MPDPAAAEPTPADHFLISHQPNRVESDRGPRYKETPADPLSPDAPVIAEPWNTVTASFFVFLALFWLLRIGRRWLDYPFVMVCMVILLAGGIGGTLYHATRTRFSYFLLDVVPIQLLGGAAAVYLIVRLGRAAGARWLLLYGGGAVVAYLAVNGLLFGLLEQWVKRWPTLPVNLAYASLAMVILLPLGAVLARTRFRHWRLVFAALLSFGFAWLARLLDDPDMVFPPMGTHWLWHTFGAITTAALVGYFYRIEREAV